MRKNVLLEAAARQGAACHQSVCRARRLLSADTQPNVINELDETIRCLETSVAEVEDVLRAAASIEDCRHSCTAYLESLRQAMRDMEELDRIELSRARTSLEEALFCLEEVKGVEGSIDGSISSCREFVREYARAIDAGMFDNCTAGTLRCGMDEAADAAECLKGLVDGYRSLGQKNNK